MASGKPELTKVTIDGIDVTSYVQHWNKKTTSNSDFIQDIVITAVRSIQNILTLDSESLINKEVIVTRGINASTETYIFRGYITTFSKVTGNVIINVADKLYLTTKRYVSVTYDKDVDVEAGVISEIFKDLISDNTSLTADNTSVQNSGTTLIRNKFICRNEKLYDKLKELADIINWMFYYNPEDDKVYFQPKGYILNTTTLTVGTNIINNPEWEFDESSLFNELRVDGAVQEANTTEAGQIGVTDGYTTSSIQLGHSPLAIRVLSDAVNPPTTELTLGVVNATATAYDYYVDKSKEQVIWNTTDYTPGGADFVQTNYIYNKPVPVSYQDSDSIELYPAGYKLIDGVLVPLSRQHSIIKEDITDVDDAELYAKQWIEIHKDPIIYTVLEVTNVQDLDIGQQISIIDTNNNINQNFYITEITQEYPYRYDKIKIVSNILEDSSLPIMIIRKLNELNRKDKENTTEPVLQVKPLSQSSILENKYLELEHTYQNGDTLIFDNPIKGILDTNTFYDATDIGFILGHPTYGVLGTATLGEGQMQTISETIIHPYNIYTELFYDTIFKQTTGFTADWDTTEEDLEVADAEVAISKEFTYDLNSLDNTIFTRVRFSNIEGTNIDNLTYQIGEDDNATINYTTVTTTGTDTQRYSNWINLNNINKYGLNWKIINSSGSTGTITKIQIELETI